jgi:hypothetical protein
MKLESVLPPLFEDRNYMAGFLSAVVPGGGMFYKGYRHYGWGFYLTELGLASYGVKNRGHKNGKYALIALGAVKGLEILTSIIIDPSYRYFRNEYDAGRTTNYSFGIFPNENNSELCYSFKIDYMF